MQEMYLPIPSSLGRPSRYNHPPQKTGKEGDAFDRLLLKRKCGWRNRDPVIEVVSRSGTHNRSLSLARADPSVHSLKS